MRRRLLLPLSVACVVSLACADDGDPARSDPSRTEHAGSGTVTVFAAASLTAAFTEIGDAFTAEHPESDVVFNFAASSELVAQIGEGAPADVFASADPTNMAELTDAGEHATEPVVFARNVLEIIVGNGNPMGITGIDDLADQDLIVVTCAPEVPCGRYANEVFAAAGVSVTPKSFEENVKAVVAKVTLGEADAGIVYRTDVIAAGSAAAGVEIPESVNVAAEYPVAVTAEAPYPEGAALFVDFVLGERGREILDSYGFLAP